jgi:hypothetical protein
MGEATSDKSTMRFLSFANEKEDAEKAAKLKEAAAKIEQAMEREKALSELVDYKEPTGEHQIDPACDTRSLYERIQEQRNKKKEELEESKKLSNWVTRLDDDDVEYLNEVSKKKQEDELRRRLEIHDALEAKRRLEKQKMLDEERKVKEDLLGKSYTTKTKSRLSSLVKIKAKMKSNESNNQATLTKTTDHTEAKSSDTKPSSSDSPDYKPPPSTPKSNPSQSPLREEAHKNRSDRIQGQAEENKQPNKSNQEQQAHEVAQCTCPKDVMTSIGVLPSLPIVKETHDSSDNNSDDDLYGRLVPRSRKRRK